MKPDKPLTRGQIALLVVFEVVATVLALVLAPVAARRVRWDLLPSRWTGGAVQGPEVVRGDLPRWAAWLGTFDERMPGAMYEQTVVASLYSAGPYWTTVRWLWRNRAFELARRLFGQPVERHAALQYTRVERGPFVLGWGWKRYRASWDAHWETGPFVAVPSVTIRLKKNG